MKLRDVEEIDGLYDRLVFSFKSAIDRMFHAPEGHQGNTIQFFPLGTVAGVPQTVMLQVIPWEMAEKIRAEIAADAVMQCPYCEDADPGELPPPDVTEDDMPALDAAGKVLGRKVQGKSGCYVIREDDYLIAVSGDPRVRERLERAIVNVERKSK